LLWVRTRPVTFANTASEQIVIFAKADGECFRVLIFSVSKAIAAKIAMMANEPAELLVVKKPRMSFE